MGWVALTGAIAADVAITFALAASGGLRIPVFAVLAVAAFAAETLLSARALRHIEAGIAYALFGMSTAVVAVLSIGFLGEAATTAKLVGLAAIVAGVVLLGTTNTSPSDPAQWRPPPSADPGPSRYPTRERATPRVAGNRKEHHR